MKKAAMFINAMVRLIALLRVTSHETSYVYSLKDNIFPIGGGLKFITCLICILGNANKGPSKEKVV